MKGFTLLEILVVIAIVAIVGTILVLIFTNTLRGSNKSQVLSVIKQNGQAVLENMDKAIRSSNNVVCPAIIPPGTSASSSNLVVENGGIYTRYRFINPSSTANGLLQQDSPTKTIDLATGNLETESVFVNRVCNTSDLMSPTATAILTDTNTQSGVSVENGSFTRNKSAGFRDQVTISFNLKPGVGAPSSIAGQIDPVSFQTTVQLR